MPAMAVGDTVQIQTDDASITVRVVRIYGNLFDAISTEGTKFLSVPISSAARLLPPQELE
ncbi:MAG: hypothetical protein NVSMB31_14500 [Vulcanimicrobiaceae bacterium]